MREDTDAYNAYSFGGFLFAVQETGFWEITSSGP